LKRESLKSFVQTNLMPSFIGSLTRKINDAVVLGI
jgi:hypothetical protein